MTSKYLLAKPTREAFYVNMNANDYEDEMNHSKITSVRMVKPVKAAVVLFVQIFLFFCSTSTGYAACQFSSCYADSQKKIPRPCMAAPTNMAFKRNITSTNTCGKPAGGYCELGPGRQCFVCDANSTTKQHPPEFMVNNEFDTPYSLREVSWWQSQTWWETNTQGLSTKDDSLKVNITLSFGRRFHISGGIKVRFYNERPLEMFLEKSKDFGKTWRVLQYFAFDCSKSYNMLGTASVDKNSLFNATCTEDYSGQYPPRYGEVEYRFDARYEPGCGYFDQDIQNFMLATNVRIRLEKPFTDGLGSLFPIEENLNKYYYAISDIVISGRCNCNGHAQYCTGPRMRETCNCEHNTAGNDCEICEPMFNNRPWMPANATHANECQECRCNSHGLSCKYNNTLGLGICTSCQHNTDGQHCEKCRAMFYRDSSVSLGHPNTCIACNCFREGVTNDGSCVQEATPMAQAGQCQCKNKVFGRQCDQCIPGYWGYRLHPSGECRACGCNNLGTINNTIQCDQYTGACPCKPSIYGRYCDECKGGFYFFPITEATECLQCPCDLGGAYPRCDKVTGSCTCRVGVEGSQCQRSEQGRFFPSLDFLKFEVEDMNGTFTTFTPSVGSRISFTGRGFAMLHPGKFACTSVVDMTLASHEYHAVIRYSIRESCFFGSPSKLVLIVNSLSSNDSSEFNIFLDQLPQGSGQAWQSRSTLQLFSDEVYNLTLTYNASDSSDNCSVLVDSLVFIPDVNITRVYTGSSEETQNRLQSCVRAKTSLSQGQSEPAQCQGLVFSVSTEIYNGTLTCGCDPVGTVAGSHCTGYGGQCPCLPGVMGRTCDSCDVGFYGFSAAGCKRCQCSIAGSLSSACHMTTGECSCKSNVEGSNCDICKSGTFNLDSGNHQGCLHCFGYVRAIRCSSAAGFVASTITSQFVNETVFNWVVVNRTGGVVPFSSSASSGLVVTSPSSPPVVYIAAPSKFLGAQFKSYGQHLNVKMEIRDPGSGQNPPAASGDVILGNGAREVALNFIPSPSPNVTSYHVILDETHVVSEPPVSPLEFQSILAELMSLKIRATYYPFPQGSVTFKEVALETGAHAQGAPGEVSVGFVENATCHVNYTGLSCEQCAQGFTREVNGSGPFGRCVLCSCNNRSTQCDSETGVCINCQVGTYGDHCELCTNNVQGPECRRCKPGYWGLSESGCKACDCYSLGTSLGNSTLCDPVTGQCMCNATANIGGRRCDRCRENSWNNSAALCEECSPCYSSIQEDVNLLRGKVQGIQAYLVTLINHPATPHNQTFVEGLRQLVANVSGLTQTINSALETDRNSTSQWIQFALAVDDLSLRLNNTIATTVNNTLHYAAIVTANRRETETAVTEIREVITEAARVLGTPMRMELEQVEVLSSSIARVAELVEELARSVKQETNRTLAANKTIHARVEYAAKTVNVATEMARNATDTQAQVAALLEPLNENASTVKVLGEQTVAMVSDKLAKAHKTYSDSLEVMYAARQANPDRTSALHKLKQQTTEARNLATEYFNQTSSLYQTSATVITQVNAAVERSANLSNEVRTVLTNSTQGHQYSNSALTAARDAVSRANRVHGHAQRMLSVANNFQNESRLAQAYANKSLLGAALIQNVTLQIIQEVSTVNESSVSILFTAQEAARLGNIVKNLSDSERQVVEKAHRLANQLMNETASAKNLINNTVENFVAREIEPGQKLCQNLSSSASNMSNHSAVLLRRAVDANSTAQRLIALIGRLLNESSSLPRVNVDNLPTLRGKVSSARQEFDRLQLGPQLVELRREIQLQKEKLSLYKDRIGKLRTDINEKRKLLASLPAVSPC